MNPVADVERPTPTTPSTSTSTARGGARARPSRGRRAGRRVFLAAAFTGLAAASWSRSAGATSTSSRHHPGTRQLHARRTTTPKSGKVRSVPMVDDVAQTLARLSTRDRFTGPDDLVFPGVTGDHLDGSALRRRYRTLRPPPGSGRSVPRPPPHLRQPCHQPRQRRAGAGLDGPRRQRHDPPLPPLQAAPRRGPALAAAFAIEQPETAERPPLDLDSTTPERVD